MSDFKDADLLITIGTSLKVHPFASLIDRVDDECPRLLINLESVGEIDEEEAYAGGTMFGRYREDGFDFNGLANGGKQNARDVRWLGQADTGVRELAQLLGWEKELDERYERGHAELDGQKGNQSPSAAVVETANAETKAQATAGKVGEVVAKPVQDPKQAEVAQKAEAKTFDKLAEELDKLGVTPKAGARTEEAKGGSDAEANQQSDEADKKAAL